jgi:tRNA modification GTPase
VEDASKDGAEERRPAGGASSFGQARTGTTHRFSGPSRVPKERVMYADDTIAAIATARGPGGIGIVRVSGPLVERIADTVIARGSAPGWESHRMYPGRLLRHDGVTIDRVLAVLMRAPRTYTGEDVLELHCHGSPAVLDRALEAVLQAGARPAVAGEFTKRAFLNGKIDLVQAEAIADLVSARSEDTVRMAAAHLLGGLSRRLEDLRRQLIDVKAKLELQIDFSDEEVEVDEAETLQALESVTGEVRSLLGTYRHGRLVREGIRVAIVGRPNVGKSSLLNALLGDDRAIVTPIPGTTRDVIEETAEFEGIAVVLSDTAGLREVPDEVERMGVERAKRVAQAADVRLLVIDRSLPADVPAQMFGVDHTIAVLNKIDLPSVWHESDVSELRAHCQVVEVSATKGLGLDALREAVLAIAGGQPVEGLPTLSRARQRDALAKAHECLKAAVESLEQKTPVDLVAVDVQAALDHIGSVTGIVTSEEVLDLIFAEFCIGK